MASGGIKRFYRQSKKENKKNKNKKDGVTKPKPSSRKTQKPTDDDDEQCEYDEVESKLRKFDMDMRYGPCVGLTRLQRWERASAMGLNPPADLLVHLSQPGNNPSLNLHCLWSSRL
ncbi:uncharacterized protein [Typha angustifolia]|uniref:uncharacterized protein n=1 Tax=Typha angustifolia TaxID=59011 RepID=UPI003C2D8B79